jgi:hypothetical protein
MRFLQLKWEGSMLRRALLIAGLGLMAAGCEDQQVVEATAQSESVDPLVTLQVVTKVQGVQASSSQIVLDGSGSTGTVKLGLADGRNPVITVGAKTHASGVAVEAALNGSKQELSFAEATRLSRGDVLRLQGDGEWEGIVVEITLAA